MANATRRCAIYTRKSSEEGLEQDYNSLHAQREACEAFISSQAGEGWRLIKTAYDDGGFSGAGMERPGLQQLLANIREGLLYHLLSNPLYLGEIRHKHERHPGQHEAIVSRELWERVQQRLRDQGARRGE